MGWTLLIALVLALGVSLLALMARRADLARMAGHVRARDRAVRLGADKARLRHPVVDLSRCLGCGTCVAACPEDDVLELVHGQAMVVHGARCEGVGACERECPVGAITVTLADVSERRDVPVLDERLGAVGAPGLYLAGEVTAHALIKTAVEHGSAVAGEVARLIEAGEAGDPEQLDLVIVGAGPAGLACALEATRLGLRIALLDQEEAPGGTVAKYPRRKLVLTQPVELPLHGRLGRSSYTKEELMDLWLGIAAEQQLPFFGGRVLEGCEADGQGGWLLHTRTGECWAARYVCLAIGRRGTPRRLGVPGEDSSKVAYSLLDAHSYQGRRVVVVGGGDSAVEAALALAEQPGNEVTLSYRREEFFRLRTRNEQRLRTALDEGHLTALTRSRVVAIHDEAVDLIVETAQGEQAYRLANDDVFAMAGGTPPFELLQRSGVSFDHAQREVGTGPGEQGTGLARALALGLALSLGALVWALWHADYYMLPLDARPADGKHLMLRPGRGVGLVLGIAATILVILNLGYLLRRAGRLGFTFGSLETWMTSHVGTGILAFLCATVHAAMAPRDSAGGHAWWALAVLILTGAIGRYFYACVPRAANGRELQLAEVKASLARMSEQWDQGQQRFRERARAEVEALVERRQWRGTFAGRVLALVGVRRDLRRLLRHLEAEGRAGDVGDEQIEETLQLARRAHSTALMAAHYEDLRAVLNSWRWLHRWVALLMVLLLVVHVVYALTYGALLEEGGLM